MLSASTMDTVRSGLRAGVPLEIAIHQLVQATVNIAVQRLRSPTGERLLSSMSIVAPKAVIGAAEKSAAEPLFPESSADVLFPKPPDVSHTTWSPGL